MRRLTKTQPVCRLTVGNPEGALGEAVMRRVFIVNRRNRLHLVMHSIF